MSTAISITLRPTLSIINRINRQEPTSIISAQKCTVYKSVYIKNNLADDLNWLRVRKIYGLANAAQTERLVEMFVLEEQIVKHAKGRLQVQVDNI